jgi:hypothetical protein
LKSSRPPALAAWLFEHLTRREHREALAGDLLEEYLRRRSDTWYWRQVLAAVVADFSTELRVRWVSVVFALVVCGTVPWNQLFHNARFQSFLLSGIQLSWPASFLAGIAIMSAFQGAILVVALGIYVVSTRSLQPRRFLTALCPALLVLAVGNTAVTISEVLPWPRILFYYYVLWRLPLFFGLVLSMAWSAPANAGRTGASRLTT